MPPFLLPKMHANILQNACEGWLTLFIIQDVKLLAWKIQVMKLCVQGVYSASAHFVDSDVMLGWNVYVQVKNFLFWR